jgi:hypothetical protein
VTEKPGAIGRFWRFLRAPLQGAEAGWVRAFKEYGDIVPHHPVPIQFHGAMAPVERARFVCPDIDTDATCPVLEKPSRQKSKQFRTDLSSTVLWNDVDPLELAVATEAAGKMSGDVTDRRPTLCGHPHRSREKRLLWVVFAGQVSQHPWVASSFTFSRQSNQVRHIRQIRFSVLDRGH